MIILITENIVRVTSVYDIMPAWQHCQHSRLSCVGHVNMTYDHNDPIHQYISISLIHHMSWSLYLWLLLQRWFIYIYFEFIFNRDGSRWNQFSFHLAVLRSSKIPSLLNLSPRFVWNEFNSPNCSGECFKSKVWMGVT